MPLLPAILSTFMWIPTTLLTFFTLLLWTSDTTFLLRWSLFHFPPLEFTLNIILDPFGTLFATTVLIITTTILIFSSIYIHQDPFLPRFTSLLILFVLSILLLIFIPNIITLLIGWDGLGLVSFLLVIYYQNSTAFSGAIITALTNRFGDVCLLIAIRWRTHQGHWLITQQTPPNTYLSLLIILAAITKRAQIPFSSWLPAAIAAPTPISALVHSSTLVTAGVFLLFRFYPSVISTPYLPPFLLLSATLTIFIAGSVALVECDLKKIIALSTLSQLGVMIARLALAMPLLTYFHLLTHALFKALLFMCAGALIHFSSHTQDLRKLGNLSETIPLTISALITANLALTGIPFFSGFYSKDIILELSLLNPMNTLILSLFLLATLLTASYSIRFIITGLWSPHLHNPLNFSHDEDLRFATPMTILILFATITGTTLNWAILRPLTHPQLRYPLKLTPLLLTLLGAYLAWKTTIQRPLPLPLQLPLHRFLSTIWFLTPLSTQTLLRPSIQIRNFALTTLDQGWLETLGPQGLHSSNIKILRPLQPSLTAPVITHFSVALLLLPVIFLCQGS